MSFMYIAQKCSIDKNGYYHTINLMLNAKHMCALAMMS